MLFFASRIIGFDKKGQLVPLAVCGEIGATAARGVYLDHQHNLELRRRTSTDPHRAPHRALLPEKRPYRSRGHPAIHSYRVCVCVCEVSASHIVCVFRRVRTQNNNKLHANATINTTAKSSKTCKTTSAPVASLLSSSLHSVAGTKVRLGDNLTFVSHQVLIGHLNCVARLEDRQRGWLLPSFISPKRDSELPSGFR